MQHARAEPPLSETTRVSRPRPFTPMAMIFPYALVGVAVGVLLLELAARVRFPWEMFVWSESPFMTNQLKLTHGLPLFGPPADVNSFVYSPGLDYLTYALLQPLGLQLDIRWCRLVNVLVSFTAALGCALATMRVATATAPETANSRFFWLTFGAAALLVHKNFTSDVPHPDNLQMLHAVVILLLCYAAVLRRRFGLAVIATMVAGIGVWTKQVEALAVLGALAALIGGARWGWRRTVLLVIGGALTCAAAVYLLWRPPYARFYLLDLLLAQGIEWPKTLGLASGLATGHRMLLILPLPAAVWHLAHFGGERGRKFLWVWLCLAVTTVLPTWAAFLKAMGIWNNLGILDVWMFILVWPLLVGPLPQVEGHRGDRLFTRLRFALLLVLLLSVFPVKLPPSAAAYAYGERLEQRIGNDLKAGKKVLLAHGTMPLIRNGATAVPLDRANSALELWVAKRGDLLTPLRNRMVGKTYERIYLNFTYGLSEKVIKHNYHLVETIPAPQKFIGVPLLFEFAAGYTMMMPPLGIYEPNATGAGPQ